MYYVTLLAPGDTFLRKISASQLLSEKYIQYITRYQYVNVFTLSYIYSTTYHHGLSH